MMNIESLEFDPFEVKNVEGFKIKACPDMKIIGAVRKALEEKIGVWVDGIRDYPVEPVRNFYDKTEECDIEHSDPD